MFSRSAVSTTVGALLMLVVGAGCSSGTPVTESWRDTSVSGPLKFHKPLALAIHPDHAIRRSAEDEMVRQILSARAVPGYQVVNDEDRMNVDKVVAKMKSSDIDGVITMSVVSSETKQTWVPAETDSLYSYYDHQHGGFGNTTTNKVVRLQTNIYRVSDGKLLWSGISDTFNPSRTEAVVADVAKGVRARLREVNLIQ